MLRTALALLIAAMTAVTLHAVAAATPSPDSSAICPTEVPPGYVNCQSAEYTGDPADPQLDAPGVLVAMYDYDGDRAAEAAFDDMAADLRSDLEGDDIEELDLEVDGADDLVTIESRAYDTPLTMAVLRDGQYVYLLLIGGVDEADLPGIIEDLLAADTLPDSVGDFGRIPED